MKSEGVFYQFKFVDGSGQVGVKFSQVLYKKHYHPQVSFRTFFITNTATWNGKTLYPFLEHSRKIGNYFTVDIQTDLLY